MLFKAVVKDKETKELKILEKDYSSKTKFIQELRRNGFIVNEMKVKKAEVFDYIMDHTNCEYGDWKYNN